MSTHSNSVCFRYRDACCNEGANAVGALRLLTKQNIGGAHKLNGTLNEMRTLNRIITVICIFIILYIIRSIIIVNYHYHHYYHRYYFLYHDYNFIPNIQSFRTNRRFVTKFGQFVPSLGKGSSSFQTATVNMQTCLLCAVGEI